MAFLGYRTPSSSATSVAEKLGAGIGEGVNALLNTKLGKLKQNAAYNDFKKYGYPDNIAQLFSRYHDQPDILKQLLNIQGIPQFEDNVIEEVSPIPQQGLQQQPVSSQEQVVKALLNKQPQQYGMQQQEPTIQAESFQQSPFYQTDNPLAALRQLFEPQAQQQQQIFPAQQLLQPQMQAQGSTSAQQPMQTQAPIQQSQPTLTPKQAESKVNNIAKRAVTYKRAGSSVSDTKERNAFIDSFTDAAQKAQTVVSEMDEFEKLVNHPSFKTGYAYQIGKTLTGLPDANTRADKILERIAPALAAVQQGSNGRITNQMLDSAQRAIPNPYQMSKESLIASARSVKDRFGIEPIEYADVATKVLRKNKNASLSDIKLDINDQLRSQNRQRYSITEGLEQAPSESFQIGQKLDTLPENPIEGMELTSDNGQKIVFKNGSWKKG